jgi:hypothetical protein
MSKKAGLTLILFIGILQFLTAQHTEIVQGREFIVHHVKHGETLYGIAKKYDVPQDTILAYNNAAQSGIKVEQVLKFPSKNALSNNNTATYIKHVVQ